MCVSEGRNPKPLVLELGGRNPLTSQIERGPEDSVRLRGTAGEKLRAALGTAVTGTRLSSGATSGMRSSPQQRARRGLRSFQQHCVIGVAAEVLTVDVIEAALIDPHQLGGRRFYPEIEPRNAGNVGQIDARIDRGSPGSVQRGRVVFAIGIAVERQPFRSPGMRYRKSKPPLRSPGSFTPTPNAPFGLLVEVRFE